MSYPLTSPSLQEVLLVVGHDIFTAPLAIKPPAGRAQVQLHAPLAFHFCVVGV